MTERRHLVVHHPSKDDPAASRPRRAGGARKVVLVELTAFDLVAPLVSGYLQAYACQDDDVRETYRFETVSLPVSTPLERIVAELGSRDGDVYGFSCYVWNMGLVRRLVRALLAERPDLPIILGGPQVMHQGRAYLSPGHPSLVLCNGEGERTFRAYLRELLSERPDLASVRGLSFQDDGQLVVTPDEDRIRDLDEIPSPYLSGLIEPFKYPYAMLETNRGCPFKCEYCYWGAAVGAKVNKMGIDRVKAEISWLAESGIVYVYIVDANWGMLKRDLELSRHLVACKQRLGLPRAIYFNTSKNNPEASAQIAEIFHEAGVLHAQPISLQTMSRRALEHVSRDNIKPETYTRLQERLNQLGASSFIELIWPLPGETLASFKDGIGKLCASGASSVCVYPLLLMHNVELEEKREAYGLKTWPSCDQNGEAEVVVETKDVSRADYDEGWAFSFAAFVLYSMRGAYFTARYLDRAGARRYDDLFSDFVAFLRSGPDSPMKDLLARAADLENVEVSMNGFVAYQCLHAQREMCDRALLEFASSQPWWSDPTARVFFEIDLLNRPYVYMHPTIEAKAIALEEVQVLAIAPDGYVVRVPREHLGALREAIGIKAAFGGATAVLKVSHWREQIYAFSEDRTMQQRQRYCYTAVHLIESILPRWEDHPAGRGRGEAGAAAPDAGAA